MAGNAYTVAAGERGVQAKVSVAGFADTVTFTARHCNQVEVVVHDVLADALYVTVDGVTTATLAGAKTDVLPGSAPCVRVLNVSTSGATVVSLFSASAKTYSVTEVI